ncbi:Jacalin-like lectin domain-containing protein [Globisporangium polare]
MASMIHVTNVREGDVLAHPLVLLEGLVSDLPALQLMGEELYLDVRLDAARGCFWPITAHAGKFKALVLLPAPGKYALTLRVCGQHHGGVPARPGALPERLFVIEYVPVVTRFVVRFYYQKCVDAENGGFDAPPGVDNSDQAAIDKIRFNALIMQMMTAEMFHDVGLPRKTFAMEFAADGLPLVRPLTSTFTNATARSIDDQELIRLVHEDIDAYGLDTHDELEFKHAVILGCSKYNPATQKPEGHTALGGERVGVFGSCGLHTWPRHLGELTACCLNNNKVDTTRLMDDSCYRGTFWANYATGIGAFLHELGHTFGLGHSDSGIMGRGFDDLSRLLCAYEIDPHCGSPGYYQQAGDGRLQLNLAAVREISSRNGAHWNPGSARILQHCPWISGVPRKSQRVPNISWVHDVCGPVGQGQYDGQQVPFNTTTDHQQHGHHHHHAANGYDLGAVLIHFGSFLNQIKTFTRTEVANWEDNQRHSKADKHLFVLLDGEFITQVDVRAMAYVDGIQIHTNKRTSRWYGGFGGVVEVLKPADGCKIHGFFGSVGDNYVGTLGALCCQVVHENHHHQHHEPVASGGSAAAVGVFPSPTVAGMALSDGVQVQFTAQCAASSLQTIAVKCDDFVKGVRVLSPEEHAICATEQSKLTFDPHEHVFDLVAGERVLRMETKSGHWVDAIRFVTNLRTSTWFGGVGGNDFIAIDSPPGHQICGFYGTTGDNFVGSIGAFFCQKQHAPSSSSSSGAAYLEGHQSQGAQGGVGESFSLMQSMPPSHMGTTHPIPPLGILVATQSNQVTSVQSFDSAQRYDEIVTQIYGTSSYGGMEVTCFPLTPAEQLVQVDVSFYHPLPASPVVAVNGVCFHTTTRCSSWIGAFNGDNLRFFIAPSGNSIQHLTGVFTNSTLTDIVGNHGPIVHSRSNGAQPQPSNFSPDGRARLDSGSFDVRVASRSSFGIQSVHLLKKNGGDHLNIHAWDWRPPSHQQPYAHPPTHHAEPHRWFVPERMLVDKIKTKDDEDPRELLFKEYVVGALDCGGGFSKAAGPPQ